MKISCLNFFLLQLNTVIETHGTKLSYEEMAAAEDAVRIGENNIRWLQINSENVTNWMQTNIELPKKQDQSPNSASQSIFSVTLLIITFFGASFTM